ncbi:helix-turn-helix domain-containing protein [Amycolatopsis nigrescens]|uniref:helix-turn-helix domain-containing protein n=1 Tax=Amycolatopsis nigrescens TaxID=381445 RepID=UPI00037CC424|nr:helix-turn-helix transcriptional regulator [Amycolatopsis nigrescens]
MEEPTVLSWEAGAAVVPPRLVPDQQDEEQLRLACRLRDCRERLGLPQRVAAQCLGIPRSAISGIESGARKVESLELKALAALYHRPVGYFLDEFPDEAAPEAPGLRVLTVAYLGLGHADRERLTDYAELLVTARERRRILSTKDA